MAVHANETCEPDPDLPQSFDPAVIAPLAAESPFTRTVNLEASLELTGVAYVNGSPVATFFNKAANRSVVVTEEPNELGWRLTHAFSGTELADTEVELMIGPETVTVHYGGAQLNPGAGKKGMPTAYVAGSQSKASSSSSSFPKTSSLLGSNGRELYDSLSSEGRDKLRETVRAYLEKNPDRTAEQRSAYAQKIYAKIKAGDQKTASRDSGGQALKPNKMKKNRPG